MNWVVPFSDADLLKYSKHHLAYEVAMFFGVGQSVPDDASATVEGRALLESFVLHLRNLMDFLYPTRIQRGSDVIGAYYFEDRCSWQAIRPVADRIRALLSARDRAHKQLVHLTIERTTRDPNWKIKELLLEMHPILESFTGRASRHLLDGAVAGAIPPLSVLWAMPDFSTSTSSFVAIVVSSGRERERPAFADECEEGA